MPRVALATVSPASLPEGLVRRYNITVVPTIINLIDGNYVEGSGISIEEFYRRLMTDEVVPSTSPATPTQLLQVFQTLLQQADAVVMVHISRHSSRTFEYACRAVEQLPGARIVNIDSGSISLGTGLQVLQAARAIEEGAGLDEVTALLEDLRRRTWLCFSPATLRYLRMSNRVGRIPALAASLLGIHPVLGVNQEGFQVLDRPRSREAAIQRMLNLTVDFASKTQPLEIGIIHTNAVAEARALESRAQELFPGVPIIQAEAGAVIGVHVGPGTLGVAMIRA